MRERGRGGHFWCSIGRVQALSKARVSARNVQSTVSFIKIFRLKKWAVPPSSSSSSTSSSISSSSSSISSSSGSSSSSSSDLLSLVVCDSFPIVMYANFE